MDHNVTQPPVSIIVRTKDRPKLLQRALKSVAVQDYRPLEVVLVNDGGCALDLGSLRETLTDVGLLYVPLPENRGRAEAANAGVRAAQGKYIGFLDDDDLYYEHHVSTLVGFLERADVPVAYTDAYEVKERATSSGYEPLGRRLPYARDFSSDWLLFQNYIPLLCLMARKDVLVREPFDPAFELFEDWDVIIRLSRRTPFQRIAETTAEFRVRQDNITVVQHPETFAHVDARYRVYRKHMGLLTERGLWVFEALDAEKHRWMETAELRTEELGETRRELNETRGELNARRREFDDTRWGLGEALKELKGAKEYIALKENELARVRDYVQQRDAPLRRVREGLVSVVVPTFNGERFMQELFDAVSRQKAPNPREVIVVDSSSRDRTVEVAEGCGARVQIIGKSSFSHPGTRNLGASLARGEFIVFVTQDALPMNEWWLSELLRPFEGVPSLAASYSRQIPRPGCDPLEARDIYTGAPCVDELRQADLKSDWQRDDYRGNLHRYIRFSNVSACYRADLLREHPFDERLVMVEDQEWAKRVIDRGFGVYYASKSVVVHSHSFGAGEKYRRFFDYGRSFRRFLEGSAPKKTQCVRATVYEAVNDFFYILNDRRRFRSKLKWICLSPVHRLAGNYGFYRGWNRA